MLTEGELEFVVLIDSVVVGDPVLDNDTETDGLLLFVDESELDSDSELDTLGVDEFVVETVCDCD